MRSYFKCLHANVFSPWWGLESKFRMGNEFNWNLSASVLLEADWQIQACILQEADPHCSSDGCPLGTTHRMHLLYLHNMAAWEDGEWERSKERIVAEWENNQSDILNDNRDYNILPMKLWPVYKHWMHTCSRTRNAIWMKTLIWLNRIAGNSDSDLPFQFNIVLYVK